VEAKSAGSERAVPGEQTKGMLQSLLEDRFQLKVHHETRDLPVYNLILIRNGPKLSKDQTPPVTVVQRRRAPGRSPAAG
jgi:uncharacterized protein (TIGR03435 family)